MDFERFQKKYEVAENGCWLWTGARCRKTGYGTFRMGSKRLGTSFVPRAHRAAWLLYRGPIPDGMWVVHKCATRHCVNPNHLQLGVPGDGSRLSKERGTHAFGEDAGRAKLTDEQVQEIRALYTLPKMKDVAAQYGVDPSTISMIVSGMRWQHLLSENE